MFVGQVAGIQDTRFQAMMPDPLHWLGVTKIDRFISMSDMKYDAIVSTVTEHFVAISAIIVDSPLLLRLS